MEVVGGRVSEKRNFWTLVIAAWQLAKVPLCLLIGCSTAFGAVLSPHSSLHSACVLGFGVMFVAMSGATLNSLQERDVDRALKRTASRPLITNRVTPQFAIYQSVILVVTGLLLLGSTDAAPEIVSVLAVLSLAMYNCLYTWLKQKTVLAIIPGAVCGAMPPVIGWTGAGGPLQSYMAFLLFTLLFLWQVPHFCLILLCHKDDYLTAQQPTLIHLFKERGVRRLSAVWICGLALVMMLFPFAVEMRNVWLNMLVIANALVLAGVSSSMLLSSLQFIYRKLFVFLNVMLGSHMCILMAAQKFLQ